MTIPTRTLVDGNEIPAVGFGTDKLNGDDGVKSVGEAMRRSGLPRDEITLATKLPGRH